MHFHVFQYKYANAYTNFQYQNHTFIAFSEFWLFRFWLVFRAPFARLFDSFVKIFIKQRLITSNDAFDYCMVLSYGIKHVYCDLYTTSFLQTIQVFWYDASIDLLYTQNINQNVLNRFIRDVRSSAISLTPTRWFSSTVSLIFSMLSSLTIVDERLTWGKFPMTSQFSLNALWYSNTYFLDKVWRSNFAQKWKLLHQSRKFFHRSGQM